MSVSRFSLLPAKVAAVAGAVFIAVVAPTVGATMSVADRDHASQTPLLTMGDDGNPWND